MGTQSQSQELSKGAVKTFKCVFMSLCLGYLICLLFFFYFFIEKILLVYSFIHSFVHSTKILPAASGGEGPRREEEWIPSWDFTAGDVGTVL